MSRFATSPDDEWTAWHMTGAMLGVAALWSVVQIWQVLLPPVERVASAPRHAEEVALRRAMEQVRRYETSQPEETATTARMSVVRGGYRHTFSRKNASPPSRALDCDDVANLIEVNVPEQIVVSMVDGATNLDCLPSATAVRIRHALARRR